MARSAAVGTTGIYRPPLPPAARLERAGAQMRKIRTSKPGVVWLQSPGPCDFWTYADETGATLELELSFFGHTIVMRDDRLMTGLSHEGVRASVLGRTGLLDFDRALDPTTLKGAITLLAAVPDKVRSDSVEMLLDAVETALADEKTTATRV